MNDQSGFVQKDALFEPEQLAEIYHALSFVREQDETLSFGRDQELAELMEQVSGLLPRMCRGGGIRRNRAA